MSKKKISEKSIVPDNNDELTKASDVRDYALSLKVRLVEEQCPAIYVLSGVNFILNTPRLAKMIDAETKEILREIWLRLKRAGIQLVDPPILFVEAN